MGEHGAHPNVFIRSFSARGELGGLSRAARGGGRLLRRRRLRPRHRRDGRHRPVGDATSPRSPTRGSSSARPGSATTCRRSRPARSRSPTCSSSARATCRCAEQTAREMREMLGLRRGLPADAWTPRVVVVRALAARRHRRPARGARGARARRSRTAGAWATPPRRSAAPVPDPATIAAGDADGWRARLAGARRPRRRSAPRSASRCMAAARAARRWR